MMMVNTSGTCATTKLTQCRSFGISMNDVGGKFARDPEHATDLGLDDFLARKDVIRQVEQWAETTRTEWAPILYLYERDWGHLVFTDMTLTRFLLVMVFPEACGCGNFSHHDYDALTKYQGDRFMSLLKYLHHAEAKPQWVRGTYVTKANGFALDPRFLESLAPPPETTRNIVHITPATFVPSLLSNELDSIDAVLKQGGTRVPKTVRYQVLGNKAARPDVSAVWKSKNPRQCAQCGAVSTKDLMLCGRCRLIHYCDRECQRLAWPLHKLVCKKT
ncbi:hypothetical protein B0H15DRAFT_923535 [Mycena belliarum]|uniref:MYND-type domain-containing protein n=1 Tax=Mycena belliarum TaxID=1033014 RepID=A0AAD6U0R6_9AGAR|nr:hypothetical protein B0H15DRAFT_923535 [Mycena belliae]